MATSNDPHPAVRPLHGTKVTELQDACEKFKLQNFKACGYEPALIWCINEYDKKLSEDIIAKTTAVSSAEKQEKDLIDIADLLVRYSQLTDTLEKMQNRRVPGGFDDRTYVDYHGQHRHVSSRHESEGNERFFDVFSRYIGPHRAAMVTKRIGKYFGLDASFGPLTDVLPQTVVGIMAGASLLVPMIIMSFETSRTARLIIVSVFTLAFGFIVGLVSLSTDTTIAATAAYAAVMVVYIGSAETA